MQGAVGSCVAGLMVREAPVGGLEERRNEGAETILAAGRPRELTHGHGEVSRRVVQELLAASPVACQEERTILRAAPHGPVVHVRRHLADAVLQLPGPGERERER